MRWQSYINDIFIIIIIVKKVIANIYLFIYIFCLFDFKETLNNKKNNKHTLNKYKHVTNVNPY